MRDKVLVVACFFVLLTLSDMYPDLEIDLFRCPERNTDGLFADGYTVECIRTEMELA